MRYRVFESLLFSRAGHLQQVRDQVAERTSLMVGTVLEALVQMPGESGADTLRRAAHDIGCPHRGFHGR